MEPDNSSEISDTNEIETNTSAVEAATQNDLSAEIPGLYELPPETQDIVVETYEHYEGLRQTIEDHTKGTEVYIEKIPEALAIIEKNISSNEQIPTEVPPEKREFVDDTVNIVTLCKKVDELGIDNLGTRKQLAIYSKLEEYAKKHNVEGLKVKLEAIKNIEEIREYYANTPKAIIQRIQDNRRVQGIEAEDSRKWSLAEMAKRRIEQHSFQEYTEYLRGIITLTTQDYSHGDKDKMNSVYHSAFRDLNDMCKGTSIASNENFMELLDEKTKAIGDIQKKISDEEVCFKQIAERTGMVTDYYPKIKIDTPLEKAKGIFARVAIRERLWESREVLNSRTSETFSKEREQLQGITMEELIPSLKKVLDRNNEYLKNCQKIQEMLPNGEEVKNFDLMEGWEKNIDYYHAGKEKKEEAFKEILGSKRLLFHGAANDESRLGIATQGAMSRRKQEEEIGRSYYRTDFPDKKEEERWLSTERESLMVFFSKNNAQHYGFGRDGLEGIGEDRRNFFFVGAPKGRAMRDYAMIGVSTYEEDSHEGELALFDKNNPEGGVKIDTNESYLFMGTDTFKHLREVYGEEWIPKMKEIWGDRVHIYDTFGEVPKSIENINLPPVNKVRLLPTRFKYTDKSGIKRGNIYTMQYSQSPI